MPTPERLHRIDELAAGLSALGLGRGHAVLVRAAVKSMGKVEGSATTALLRALLDVVGEQGTVLGLAFTASVMLPWRKGSPVFDGTNPPNTGGFASAMVAWPGAYRSRHPTNSWVGIGQDARGILEEHDEGASCFQPVERLMERDGRMILVGCTTSSPGFSTVHLVQHHLGLSRQCILGPISGARYLKEGRTLVYRRRDVPGCSYGFGAFYPEYARAGKLLSGLVGEADSLGIAARDAYAVERAVMERDPRFPLCRRPDCRFCRGTLLYNLRDAPRYWLSRLTARRAPAVAEPVAQEAR